MPRTRLSVLLCCLLCCSMSGCRLFFRAATKPMPFVTYAAVSPEPNGLMVLVPGFGDSPESFEENGFIEMIRIANPRFDVIAVDAHFSYYWKETVVDRIHEDVIAPLRGKYEHVWFVGISMGGFGASVYALEHSEDIDGLILLAPYMGHEEIIEEVHAAGGLASWTPPNNWHEIEDNETRKYYELWNWLRGYADSAAPRPKLLLGYGTEDEFRLPNSLLGDVLPDAQKDVRSGGHTWRVWRSCFGSLLPRAIQTTTAGAR